MSLTGLVPKTWRKKVNDKKTEITNEVVPCPRIGQFAVNRIQHCSQENIILQTDIDEHRRLCLVDTCIQHFRDADRRRRGRQSLQANSLQGSIRVQWSYSNGLVFASNSLHKFQVQEKECKVKDNVRDMASSAFPQVPQQYLTPKPYFP